jgi:acyl carrier protein
VEATEAWDSLANFSLVTVLEEEFDLQIPSEDLEQLTSFASVEAYLALR